MKRKTFRFIDDDEWLLNKYNIEKLNIKEISNIEGCSKTPVKRRLLKLGINIRNANDDQDIKRRRRFPSLFNQNWIIQKYLIEKQSTYKIADLIGCSQNLVLINLKRMDVAMRSVSENRKGIHHSERTKEKIGNALKKAYESERKIKPTKGESFSYENEFHKGDKPWNYKGGIISISFLKQHGVNSEEWQELAKKIRKRDNYICQYCGNIPSFHVHHIIPRRIKIDNHPDNLITLCEHCHPKVESLTTKYIEQNRDPIEIFYEKWSK